MVRPTSFRVRRPEEGSGPLRGYWPALPCYLRADLRPIYIRWGHFLFLIFLKTCDMLLLSPLLAPNFVASQATRAKPTFSISDDSPVVVQELRC